MRHLTVGTSQHSLEFGKATPPSPLLKTASNLSHLFIFLSLELFYKYLFHSTIPLAFGRDSIHGVIGEQRALPPSFHLLVPINETLRQLSNMLEVSLLQILKYYFIASADFCQLFVLLDTHVLCRFFLLSIFSLKLL